VSSAAVAVLAALVTWFGVELITGGGLAGLSERVFGAAQAMWPLAVVASCRHSAWKRARLGRRPDAVSRAGGRSAAHWASERRARTIHGGGPDD
jgi:hypothetical protein